MLIFDQHNKADRHLRVRSWIVAMGILVLLGGLWWVQVVRASHFAEAQSNQSYRTVRVPGPRGKILDRNGVVLAANRPVYNVSLYLGDRAWRDQVNAESRRRYEALREMKAAHREPNVFEKVLGWFGYKPALAIYQPIKRDEIAELRRTARYVVTSNIVAQLGEVIGRQLVL